VPEARPIEKFWAICKAKYKKNNVKAEVIKILGLCGEQYHTKLGKRVHKN